MPLSKDRWMPLREIAVRHGKSVKQLREVAEDQNGKFKTPRFTERTKRRWPRFSKDPNGFWGCWESQYINHFNRNENGGNFS